VLSQTVTVAVRGDTIDEVNETFSLNLTAGANVAIARGQSIVTIADNDPLPSMSIGNAAVTEPAIGIFNANFNVTLSAASGKTVTVVYNTASGTATSPADYTGVSGTLTFAPGVTTLPVAVAIKADQLAENTETFFVNLSSSVNAVLNTVQGTGTIINYVPPAPVSAGFVSSFGAPSVTPSALASVATQLTGTAAESDDDDLTAIASSAALVAAPSGECSTRQKATDRALEDDSLWLDELLVA